MVKVVIQTGDVLDRAAIDDFISAMPENWKALVLSIVVCGSRENDLRISYHNSEKTVNIHSPIGCSLTKWEALEELAVSLYAVAELGRVPRRLARAKKKEYAQRWQEHCSSA